MRCHKCGNEVSMNFNLCPYCGAKLNGQEHIWVDPDGQQRIVNDDAKTIFNPSKSSLVAVLLSFFLPGLGQMYLGQIGKGILLFMGALLLNLYTAGLAHLVFLVLTMIDAYKINKKMKRGYPVGKYEFFWQ